MDFKSFKEMLKRIFFVIFTAAVLACHAEPKPQPIVEGVTNVMPDEQQKLVIKEVVNLIESYNYKKKSKSTILSHL